MVGRECLDLINRDAGELVGTHGVELGHAQGCQLLVREVGHLPVLTRGKSLQLDIGQLGDLCGAQRLQLARLVFQFACGRCAQCGDLFGTQLRNHVGAQTGNLRRAHDGNLFDSQALHLCGGHGTHLGHAHVVNVFYIDGTDLLSGHLAHLGHGQRLDLCFGQCGDLL